MHNSFFLANWSATWLTEWEIQKREQPSSLTTSKICYIQSSNFHELFSLLMTQDITAAESPYS